MLRELHPADLNLAFIPFRTEQETEMTDGHVYNDPLDDVFGSDTDEDSHETHSNNNITERSNGDTSVIRANTDRSDVPRLRETHFTNGYREGVAEAKESFIQAGFDEGFSVGAEIGYAAGECLGLLDGLCLSIARLNNAAAATSSADANEPSTLQQEAREMLTKAKQDLSPPSLFDQAFFAPDGKQKYGVSETENHVHPLISKWKHEIDDLAKKIGLQLLVR